MPSIDPPPSAARDYLVRVGIGLGPNPAPHAYDSWKAAVRQFADSVGQLQDIDNGFWQGEHQPPPPPPNRAGGRDVVVDKLKNMRF